MKRAALLALLLLALATPARADTPPTPPLAGPPPDVVAPFDPAPLCWDGRPPDGWQPQPEPATFPTIVLAEVEPATNNLDVAGQLAPGDYWAFTLHYYPAKGQWDYLRFSGCGGDTVARLAWITLAVLNGGDLDMFDDYYYVPDGPGDDPVAMARWEWYVEVIEDIAYNIIDTH